MSSKRRSEHGYSRLAKRDVSLVPSVFVGIRKALVGRGIPVKMGESLEVSRGPYDGEGEVPTILVWVLSTPFNFSADSSTETRTGVQEDVPNVGEDRMVIDGIL